ncbi:hypothetical protein AMAG_13751 [Allomyces macrogynus ATCC 38327]|uniref:SHSP domain-containing protein n=1 Tax=Allomyces macrogynus (strain ATCC 38327) TaxID=578462 RepID=A0A0L0T3T7_ALLM3|nr:hypothetical protein AMAG_13751 [Allomyces macrogynus ATCC 38327]|eukprot:KNE69386.1 hypothetical protein AMAG_13751 [Allomyces macrogynus ATCC 38327]
MALIFEPLTFDRSFYSMRRELDRMLRDLYEAASRGGAAGDAADGDDPVDQAAASFSPRMDVVETESEIVIKLDTPGVPKENITVEVHDRVLTIAGEANVDGEKVDGTVHVRERYAGKFERQMALPPAADTDAIKAASVDGVLTVTVPKKAEVAEKRQIAVE